MASRNKPKNVSAWLGGNRGTVQSGGGKPMGIVDDIAKGIKDIASPWLPAAPRFTLSSWWPLAIVLADTMFELVRCSRCLIL